MKQRIYAQCSNRKQNKRLIVNLLFVLGSTALLSACGGAPAPHEKQDQDQVQRQVQDQGQGQPLDLPVFESPQQLEASPWQQYFMDVYGNIPTSASDYPLDLNEWWIFYNEYLSTIGKIHPGIRCRVPARRTAGE